MSARSWLRRGLLVVALLTVLAWPVHSPAPAALGQGSPAGDAWAWGNNFDGQLGDSTAGRRRTPAQVLGPEGVGFLTDVAAIAAGEVHSLALKADGTVWAWGGNYSGQLGDGTITQQRLTPVQVRGPGGVGFLTDVAAIAAGFGHSLALKADGAVWAWGRNDQGQLGDGTTGQRLTPVQVRGPDGKDFLANVAALAAGSSHSLALKADGTVWAWGSNFVGQLGDGTITQRLTPVQVRGPGGVDFLTDVAAIAAGSRHSLALKADGTAWAWGANNSGQLGDGTTTNRFTPVQVRGPGGVDFLTDVAAIAARQIHSLALKADGAVWAWGDNSSGQLGDGTTTNRVTPVQVLGPGGVGFLTDVAAIAAGQLHSLALKADGAVWAWGFNSSGQLGDGTTTRRLTPVQVLGPGGVGFLTDVAAIAGGFSHSLAVRGGPQAVKRGPLPLRLPSPTATATAAATGTPPSTATSAATPTATATPTPTAMATATPTPARTATPSAVPTATSTPGPTATSTPSAPSVAAGGSASATHSL